MNKDRRERLLSEYTKYGLVDKIAELEAQLAEARRELVSVTDELGSARDDLADMVRRIDKALTGEG